ncbi:MAG: hypothetical protein ACYTFQ_24010 [Planctomycetota bacterium]
MGGAGPAPAPDSEEGGNMVMMAIWPPTGMRGRVREVTFKTWADAAQYMLGLSPHVRVAVEEKKEVLDHDLV